MRVENIEKEVTLLVAARVWWSFFWRAMLLSIVITLPLHIALSLLLPFFGITELLASRIRLFVVTLAGLVILAYTFRAALISFLAALQVGKSERDA